MTEREPFAVDAGDVEKQPVPHHDGVRGRELVNPERGSEDVVFRLSTLDPGGHDSWHAHDGSDQLIFVRSGTGRLQVRDPGDGGDGEPTEYDLEPETFVFLPAGTPHHARNTGDEPLDLIAVWAPPYGSVDEWADGE